MVKIKGLTCYTDIEKFKRNNTQLQCIKKKKDGIFFTLNDDKGYGIVLDLPLKTAIFRIIGFSDESNTITPSKYSPLVWLVITLFFNKVSFEDIFELCRCNKAFNFITKEEIDSADGDLEKTLSIYKNVTTCITNLWTPKEILKEDTTIENSHSIVSTFPSKDVNIDILDASNTVSTTYDKLADTFGHISSDDPEMQIDPKEWQTNLFISKE